MYVCVLVGLKHCQPWVNTKSMMHCGLCSAEKNPACRVLRIVNVVHDVLRGLLMNPSKYIWPIPGKVKVLLISGKKSASLLNHISRFLSHQFVTWYLRSISKTKIVKLFCPCMSEHKIYIKNVTNLTQTLHQNITNVTKQNIASKEILTIEFHTKYMKLFVNMLSVICVLLNTKFHNTSENIYFEVILSRTIVSCKVTNVTNRYMDFILNLDEEFNCQRPVCLDSNRIHYYQSKICW